MKRILLVGLVIAGLGFLVVSFALPALAHGPEGGEAAPANHEAWEAMHEACESGDWEAMAEAAEEVHGEDFGSMPCHDEGWGHMGGGMMGGGWGGMMGW